MELDPGKNQVWQNEQRQFWENRQAFDTQAVFDALNGTESLTKWRAENADRFLKVIHNRQRG